MVSSALSTSSQENDKSLPPICDCGRAKPACVVRSLKDVPADYANDFVTDNGDVLPVCHLRCKKPIPLCTCQNLPTSTAKLNGHRVVFLRDTGCSGVVVKGDYVMSDQYTGQHRLCLMVDGTVRKVPLAVVNIDTPYFAGSVEAMVMPTPIYDLILGNIPGCRGAEDLDLSSTPKTTVEESAVVVTRIQHADSLIQTQNLTASLQKLQTSTQDTRDSLTQEVAEGNDSLLKIKELKEMAEKHNEALATVRHRGKSIKQLREELKASGNRVGVIICSVACSCAVCYINLTVSLLSVPCIIGLHIKRCEI